MRAGWEDLNYNCFKRDLGIVTLTVSWTTDHESTYGYVVTAGNNRLKKLVHGQANAMEKAEDMAKRYLREALDKLKEV